MKVSDYFAELYVAGRFADTGWNVYFPHRDKGFDFIISKVIRNNVQLIRPVQVKGKYPTKNKSNKTVYGYVGKLSQLHPEMVLAIPYFSSNSQTAPIHVAYMPLSLIKQHSRGFRCQPAAYKNEVSKPRPNFEKFFDEEGLNLLESESWKNTQSG